MKIEFTYNVPNDFLESDDSLGLTVTRAREFEDRYWGVLIAKEQYYAAPLGSVVGKLGPIDKEIFHNSFPEKDDVLPLILDVTKDPDIVDLLYRSKDSDFNDEKQFKQFVKILPDGRVYTRPDITDLPIQLAYDEHKLRYNLDKKEWVRPFQYFENWSSWEGLERIANEEVQYAVNKINTLDKDDPRYQKWVEFKVEMENKIPLYKQHGVKPVECVFPPHPEE